MSLSPLVVTEEVAATEGVSGKSWDQTPDFRETQKAINDLSWGLHVVCILQLLTLGGLAAIYGTKLYCYCAERHRKAGKGTCSLATSGAED